MLNKLAELKSIISEYDIYTGYWLDQFPASNIENIYSRLDDIRNQAFEIIKELADNAENKA